MPGYLSNQWLDDANRKKMERVHMDEKLERILAAHCAPVLAGIKTANLVACPFREFSELPARVKEYNRAFGKKGLRFEILCVCRERFLLLVYRSKRLETDLRKPAAKEILRLCGYPEGLREQLAFLRDRILKSVDFPHEIGLFLGYPPCDVKGFMEHGGKGCKLSGCWKVYGDAAAAERLFERYQRCSRATCERVESGIPLMNLFAVS